MKKLKKCDFEKLETKQLKEYKEANEGKLSVAVSNKSQKLERPIEIWSVNI